MCLYYNIYKYIIQYVEYYIKHYFLRNAVKSTLFRHLLSVAKQCA